MSLILRIALLALSAWSWQFITSGALFLAVFVGTVLACFWVQFQFHET